MNIKVKNFGKFFAARKQVGSKIVTKNETKKQLQCYLQFVDFRRYNY